jgi:CRP/FNR family cyclic AMP-dependent transcriptional regulator
VDRYLGANGRRLRLDALASSKLVGGDPDLAAQFDDNGEVVVFGPNETVIEQGADDNDVFLILSGVCRIVVNGRIVGQRGPGDHIGEMAAVQHAQRRSATVITVEGCVLLKVRESEFTHLADHHPRIYREIAKELARRLLQRNAGIGAYRDKIRIFIISSVEALPIARALQNAFEHDPFNVVVWTDGVFKVANYTLESLEQEVDISDFAIAIAHADDVIESRDKNWPSPRDNVILELGLFIGRLGRTRAILMEPRGERLKLPSDLAGLTTIPYRFEKGTDTASVLAPACNRLRTHILTHGPHNG